MMTNKELALSYHNNLMKNKPFGVWEHLTVDRGLSINTIIKFRLGYKDNSITIPIYNKEFDVVDIKFRHLTGKLRYTHMKGGKPEIYGWERLLKNDKFIYVEGELNRLILEDRGVPAITVSGGAGEFNKDWIPYFKDKKIWFWFDSDDTGKKGVKRVVRILDNIPKFCRNISPECLKEKEDAVDYFVKYKRSVSDLKEEIKNAKEIIVDNNNNRCKKSDIDRFIKEKDTNKEIKILNSFDFIHKTLGVDNTANPVLTICPFHKDKNPSMAIYDGTGYHCFSCGAHGDGNIDFVMKFLGFSYREAVDYLRNYYNSCYLNNIMKSSEEKNVKKTRKRNTNSA